MISHHTYIGRTKKSSRRIHMYSSYHRRQEYFHDGMSCGVGGFILKPRGIFPGIHTLYPRSLSRACIIHTAAAVDSSVHLHPVLLLHTPYIGRDHEVLCRESSCYRAAGGGNALRGAAFVCVCCGAVTAVVALCCCYFVTGIIIIIIKHDGDVGGRSAVKQRVSEQSSGRT